MFLILIVIDLAILKVEDINTKTYLEQLWVTNKSSASYLFIITISPLLCFLNDKIYSILENKLTLYESARQIYLGIIIILLYYNLNNSKPKNFPSN